MSAAPLDELPQRVQWIVRRRYVPLNHSCLDEEVIPLSAATRVRAQIEIHKHWPVIASPLRLIKLGDVNGSNRRSPTRRHKAVINVKRPTLLPSKEIGRGFRH